MTELLRPYDYETRSNNEKRALRIALSDLYNLYKEYCSFESLGIPQILKNLKQKLTENGFTVARSKNGMEIRGILLNTEKCSLLGGNAPSGFRMWFSEKFGMPVEAYNETYKQNPENRCILRQGTTNEEWTGSKFMKPRDLEHDLDDHSQVNTASEDEKIHELRETRF